MAFGSQDSAAINTAVQAGVIMKGNDIVDPSHILATMVCPQTLNTTEPASILANAIEALDRFAAGTTVCVEVEGPLPVPFFIKDAIEKLEGYPAKIVVVCDGASTQAPGPLLDEDLRQAVKNASRGGALWHPIEKKLVW